MCQGFSYNISYDDAIALPNRIGEFQILADNGRPEVNCCYHVNIHVHPGEQYRAGELNFTGATILSADELRAELHMKPNSVFNTESVRRGLENIEKSYAKKGHPNVTAIPVASVDEKNRKIALEIKLQESSASQQVP
jgi:outer membrane protein assembly factor BamA